MEATEVKKGDVFLLVPHEYQVEIKEVVIENGELQGFKTEFDQDNEYVEKYLSVADYEDMKSDLHIMQLK